MAGKYNVMIDLDRLKDPYNGLGQVAINLGDALSKLNDDKIRFTFLVPEKFVGHFGNNVSYEKVSLRRRLTPWLCPGVDLWYTIHQDSWYFPSRKRKTYILTINDLNFLGEKEGMNLRYRMKRLQLKVNRAQVVTTISRFTESEVRKNLKTTGKDIRVIYFGVKVNIFDNPAKPSFVPDGDLLFTVGVIQPKKNFAVLIDFMKELPEHYVLVIAGNKRGEHSIELESQIRSKGLEKRIILPGLISDEDKYWLYTHCKAVVFPSKLEGMGFPPVEAMRLGKPVFASTFSSIPEVSEDKAYYWENFDPQKMARFFLENLKNFESDPGRPELLRQYSMRFTWEHVAEQYLSLFKEVLEIG